MRKLNVISAAINVSPVITPEACILYNEKQLGRADSIRIVFACHTYIIYKGRMYGVYMSREQENDRFRHKLAEAASMPKDVVLGVPIITITGCEEICIENYRGIIEYTEVLIRVQTKISQIKIQGKKLQIEYYTNDEMKITGHMISLEYCK